MGGQGFDPCLLHIIFLNYFLQIQYVTPPGAHHMLYHHHHQINHPPDLRPRNVSPWWTSLPQQHWIQREHGPQDLDFGTIQQPHPQSGFHTPPFRLISHFFYLFFLVLYYFVYSFFFIIKSKNHHKKIGPSFFLMN